MKISNVMKDTLGWVMISAATLTVSHVLILLHKSMASFLAKVMSIGDICGKYKKDPPWQPFLFDS